MGQREKEKKEGKKRESVPSEMKKKDSTDEEAGADRLGMGS